MTETVSAQPERDLKLRDTAVVDERAGEVAIYLHDLGGGSVLRGVPALMFRSLHSRFGASAFTVVAAAEDRQAGDTEKWRGVLTALTDRGILVTAARKRGSVSAPERLIVEVNAEARLVSRLTELVAAMSNVEIRAGADDDMSSPATRIGVWLDTNLSTAEVRAFAKAQAALGRQSVTVRLYGDNIELGPWTVPGRTPCFECYWVRLQAGRDRTPPEEFWRSAVGPEPQQSTGTLAAEAALPLLATEIAKAAAGAPPVTMGQVARLELSTLQLVKHKVVNTPACPTCAVAYRAGL